MEHRGRRDRGSSKRGIESSRLLGRRLWVRCKRRLNSIGQRYRGILRRLRGDGRMSLCGLVKGLRPIEIDSRRQSGSLYPEQDSHLTHLSASITRVSSALRVGSGTAGEVGTAAPAQADVVAGDLGRKPKVRLNFTGLFTMETRATGGPPPTTGCARS